MKLLWTKTVTNMEMTKKKLWQVSDMEETAFQEY